MATPTRIARIGPEAFWPAPEVNSAMLRLDVSADPASTPALKRALARLVHGCFLHRRKTLRSNLRTILDASTLERVARDGRWNLDDRPEQLTVAQWVALAAFLDRCSYPQ